MLDTGPASVVVVDCPDEGADDVVVLDPLGVFEPGLDTGTLELDGLCSVVTPKNPTTAAPRTASGPFNCVLMSDAVRLFMKRFTRNACAARHQ